MSRSVLIIEDDIEMCNELSEALKDKDNLITIVHDGLEGKKIIEKNTCDIIILDLKIPRCNGYQILDFINSNNTDAKVVVMTARMDIHSDDLRSDTRRRYEDSLLSIADCIMLKPFRISELVDIVNL